MKVFKPTAASPGRRAFRKQNMSVFDRECTGLQGSGSFRCFFCVLKAVLREPTLAMGLSGDVLTKGASSGMKSPTGNNLRMHQMYGLYTMLSFMCRPGQHSLSSLSSSSIPFIVTTIRQIWFELIRDSGTGPISAPRSLSQQLHLLLVLVPETSCWPSDKPKLFARATTC